MPKKTKSNVMKSFVPEKKKGKIDQSGTENKLSEINIFNVDDLFLLLTKI